ncbi:hypothetical protein NEHOM01_0601 [Nematocida homosporus]|uniref:uncharacterized protein n=1 Tax=Nematocida homosporus TaxID=1912981 RepID=UPI002220D268|nr:uncharacterized protein NEHOM01_0601 [Nematocida homosporus]KAI5185096.1 hypothetical protein NEHOM01_0601 [Nematocida homosporus]
MVFHSLTIRPQHIYTQESIERDTILKSVSLTPIISAKTERVSLLMQVDNQPEINVCTLLVNTCESKVLNLPLKAGTSIQLSSLGSSDLDLLFYELSDSDLDGGDRDSDFEEGEVSEVSEVSSKSGLNGLREVSSGYMSVTVRGGQRVSVQEEVSLRVVNAAVRVEEGELQGGVELGRTVLFMQGEERDVPLVTFIPGRSETEVLDLEIAAGEEIVFGVAGPNAVDLLILRGDELEEEELSGCTWVTEEESAEEESEEESEEEENGGRVRGRRVKKRMIYK